MIEALANSIRHDVAQEPALCRRLARVERNIMIHPNSNHWKAKADTVWSKLIRVAQMRCVICGKAGMRNQDGLFTNGLQAHHLIGRAVLKYRYDFMNGACLCLTCHGAMPDRRNRRCAAHGTGIVYERFCKELRVKQPEQWEWWEAHKDDRLPFIFTFQEAFETLKEDLKRTVEGVS